MRIPRKSSNATPYVVTDEFQHLPNPADTKQLPRRRQLLAATELRNIFMHIVEEPLPNELLDLLRQIDSGRNVEKANEQPRAAYGWASAEK